MAISNYLAEIWGVSMIAVALALLIKEKHLKKLFSAIETEQGLFFWGVASFVIGVAQVLAHNIWVSSWQVVVTILGWIVLIKGLSFLFFPEMVKAWTKKMENKQWLPVALVAAVLVGLVITYLGFTGK